MIKCVLSGQIAIEVFMWDIMKYVLSGLDQIVIEVYMWDKQFIFGIFIR
jgi:hypothetical protein